LPEPHERPWRIRSKVWLERDQQVLLSDFRATLLERIDALGSVSAAAQDLDLPNRTAWKKLQEMEAAAGLVTERFADERHFPSSDPSENPV
jgi:molybdenum-dependent DNA-binding transcriptional regulator ModE